MDTRTGPKLGEALGQVDSGVKEGFLLSGKINAIDYTNGPPHVAFSEFTVTTEQSRFVFRFEDFDKCAPGNAKYGDQSNAVAKLTDAKQRSYEIDPRSDLEFVISVIKRVPE